MAVWQKVYEDQALYRAEIVKSVLEDRGLSPVIVNKKDSSIQFGHYEVQVAPDDVLQSIKIIKEEISFG
ncbi:MAG: hypothetical protein OEY56_04985 [Cyclobacteriaceae bacterium]|nr:hypothetical protein [Cyclobacteriaceae bacterium]